MKRFDSVRFVALILALVLIVGLRDAFAAPRKPAVKPSGNTTFEGIDLLPAPSRANVMLPSGVNSVSARFVPEKEQPQSGEGTFRLGWIVVEISLKPDWHVYSMRQKSGGYPTRIRMEKSFVDSKEIHIGDFEAATPTESELFQGNVLEEMKGHVAWIAPVFFGKKVDSAVLKSVLPRGELDALACSAGTNGACHPLNVPFEARPDDQFDIAPYLTFVAQANATLDSFKKAQREQGAAGQAAIAPTPKTQTSPKAAFSWTILFWAFCGGLLLNVMPCVLPVIGLKIVTFFEQAGQSRSRAFILNLWYTLGMLCVFISLAMMSVGLSYLFTYGLFQIVMGSIVFVMALSLMGLWELHVPAFLGGQKSGKLMEKEGGTGAFFKGIITTLLAIPCGAPLLSPALVWSDTMIQQGNTFMVLFVYIVIGLGMAFPYLVVGAFPELLGFLPKPGLWMETFRIVMGYVLLLAVVWILFSMPQTLVIPTVTLLFALWFGCWFIGRLSFDATGKQKTRAWLVSLAVVAVTILLSFNIKGIHNPYSLENAVRGKMIRWAIRAEREGLLEQNHWSLFDDSRFKRELAEGHPVMIDFTADWCMNCKLLESTVLHSQPILDLIDQKGIVTMTADWTNQNDQSNEMKAINQLLDQYGGRQVPVIMIFAPGNPEPEILRGLFTTAELVNKLDKLPNSDNNKR